MKKVVRLTESELIKVIESVVNNNIFEEKIVQGKGSDPYQYKSDSGKFYYAKKGSQNWIEQTDPDALSAIQTDIFKLPSDKTKLPKTGGGGGKSTAFGTGEELGKKVKHGLKKGVELIGDAIQTQVNIAKQVIKFTFTATSCIVYIGIEGFKLNLELGKKVLNFLGSLSKKAGDIIVSNAKKVGNFTKDMVSKAVGGVVGFFKSLFNLIKKLGTKVYIAALQLASKIGDIWQHIKSWGAKTISDAWSTIKKTGKDIYDKTTSTVSGAWDTAKDLGSGFVSGLMNEDDINMMFENYKHYNSLPLLKMINEIRIDTRQVIF